MRLILSILIALTLPARAVDVYVSQAGDGAQTGVDAANAHSLAWANTAANWGGGAGEIDPGDTVKLVGTFTGKFEIQTSGSSGNRIVVKFEPGAKISAPRFEVATGALRAAIYANNKSYITVDGNGGLIEATDTGTTLTYQDANVGVLFFGGGQELTVQNLTITNMYRRTPGSASDENQVGGGVQFRGGTFTTMLVTNVAVWQANAGIYLGFNGACSGLTIANSSGGDCGEGVLLIGAENGSSTMQNVLVTGCDLKDEFTWSGVAVTHCNLIHFHSTPAGSSITGVTVEKSKFHGTGSSHMTSFIFFEGFITNLFIQNNLIAPSDATFQGNGHLTLKGAPGAKVLNNTFIGTGAGIGIGTTSFGASQDHSYVLTNNLVGHYGHGVYDPGETISAADYNIFFDCDNMANFGDWSTWTVTLGFDGNGSDEEPSIDANYVPTAADTVARNQGVVLVAVTDDYNGNDRDANPDIGAFEYVAGSPPAGVTLNVNGTVSVGTVKQTQ